MSATASLSSGKKKTCRGHVNGTDRLLTVPKDTWEWVQSFDTEVNYLIAISVNSTINTIDASNASNAINTTNATRYI